MKAPSADSSIAVDGSSISPSLSYNRLNFVWYADRERNSGVMMLTLAGSR